MQKKLLFSCETGGGGASSGVWRRITSKYLRDHIQACKLADTIGTPFVFYQNEDYMRWMRLHCFCETSHITCQTFKNQSVSIYVYLILFTLIVFWRPSGEDHSCATKTQSQVGTWRGQRLAAAGTSCQTPSDITSSNISAVWTRVLRRACGCLWHKHIIHFMYKHIK